MAAPLQGGLTPRIAPASQLGLRPRGIRELLVFGIVANLTRGLWSASPRKGRFVCEVYEASPRFATSENAKLSATAPFRGAGVCFAVQRGFTRKQRGRDTLVASNRINRN